MLSFNVGSARWRSNFARGRQSAPDQPSKRLGLFGARPGKLEELDPAYERVTVGGSQSPVDIKPHDAIGADLPPLDIQPHPQPLHLSNNYLALWLARIRVTPIPLSRA